MSAEKEPNIGINLGQTRFEMTRNNTYLYTFLGRAALYNHVFLKRDDLPELPDGRFMGTYLFKDVLREGVWNQLESTLRENNYPSYLNHPEPSQMDKDAYLKTILGDIDQVPDWLPEE